jgi:hypothetical protein
MVEVVEVPQLVTQELLIQVVVEALKIEPQQVALAWYILDFNFNKRLLIV